MTQTNLTFEAAKAYIGAGISVLPTSHDKFPAISSWKSRQNQIPTIDDITREFSGNGNSVALVAGKVSRNLECLDFDFKAKYFLEWTVLVNDAMPGLLDKLVIQETQNGGLHAIYRCAEPVQGSQKLATEGIEVSGPGEQKYQGKRIKAVERNGKHYLTPCYIETKGEGGYFLCDPSEGYTITQGKISQVSTITAYERNVLISSAKALNKWIPESRPDPVASRPRSGLSPGDDFALRGDVAALLLNQGWTPTGRQAKDGELWRRPGKDKGWSATLFTSNSLYVFTSNAPPFEQETSYSPLAVYTLLEYGGDYKAAVKALAGQGYGDDRPMTETDQERATTQAEKQKKALGDYIVKQEYTDNLGSEEWLVDNLVIKQHITTVIADAGGGKTSLFFFYAAPHMAERGYDVWYFDADSPPSDHKMMYDYAKKHNFKFAIPDVNEGLDVDSLKKQLTEMADRQENLDGKVYIFDTLKKYVDIMSKSDNKSFFILLRRLTKLGATIILLGHANKYRDKDGNLIFEGTNDVRSDSDDLIHFSHAKKNDGTIDITTMVDPAIGAKVRGLFKPFSFNIDQDRKVTFYNDVKTPIDLRDPNSFKATDLDILDTATSYLKQMKEPVSKTALAQHTSDMVAGQAGEKRVRKIITQHAVKKGTERPLGTRFIYTLGEKNTHLYEVAE